MNNLLEALAELIKEITALIAAIRKHEYPNA